MVVLLAGGLLVSVLLVYLDAGFVWFCLIWCLWLVFWCLCLM